MGPRTFTIVSFSFVMAATAMTLTGCGNRAASEAQTSIVPHPAVAVSTAYNPIDQPDADFKAHNWSSAIAGYKVALNAGLPHGDASTHGTDAYARAHISLAHEYSGLAYQGAANYDASADEYRQAIAADSKNSTAKRLLRAVQHRQAVDVAEANRQDQQFSQSTQVADVQQRPQGYRPQQGLTAQDVAMRSQQNYNNFLSAQPASSGYSSNRHYNPADSEQQSLDYTMRNAEQQDRDRRAYERGQQAEQNYQSERGSDNPVTSAQLHGGQ